LYEFLQELNSMDTCICMQDLFHVVYEFQESKVASEDHMYNQIHM